MRADVMVGVERVVQWELAAKDELEGAGHFDVDGRWYRDQGRRGGLVLAVVGVAVRMSASDV